MAGNLARRPHVSQRQLTLGTDLYSNNSFDSNMGAGLGPAFQQDMSYDCSVSAFTSVNAPMTASSMQTVSPKDIFSDPFSAPPSTAFTNLTTPDGTPYMDDSFNTSPMFQGDGILGQDNWFSLFPEESELKAGSPDALLARDVLASTEKADFVAPMAPSLDLSSIPMSRSTTTDSQSMARSPSCSASSPIVLDAHRRKSSVNRSPVANVGVSKPRRRKGPLPPITVDPEDKIALKRARNTLAARDSRQRKFDHVQNLERTVSELQQQNSALVAELEKYKAMVAAAGLTE